MKPHKTVFDKPWIPYKNRVDFFLSGQSDFDAPVTTVHGFFFNSEGQLLLIQHCCRGWEIPGGHVDLEEGYESAMHRELYEETQMKVAELFVLGHLKKSALEEKPEGCLYPHPLSYYIFYGGKLTVQEPFEGDASIVDYKFVDVSSSRDYKWIQSYELYLDEAIRKLKV